MTRNDVPILAAPAAAPRGPLRLLLDLFSSIWTGIVLLSLLFVYSTIGSAVPPFRQMPAFEMTEFEWFHTPVFVGLIALICLNIVVATLRRIPFKPVNFGVWMIHTGNLILATGCVIYFGTKLEGDSPIARRMVSITVPDHPTQELLAFPGNSVRVGSGPGAWIFQIASIDPQWEILSGEDQGERTYSVNIAVQRDGQMFIRQLLAGYPEYTEDLVRSSDPNGPPWARAKKVTGDAIIDSSIELGLTYAPQEWMYLSNDLAKSWALYLRERPADGSPPGPWVQRRIDGLPLYNDYVAELDDVFRPAPRETPNAWPLAIEVPASEPDDPLPETSIGVKSYLRYALMQTRRIPGGDRLDPAITINLETDTGGRNTYDLVAFDPFDNREPSGRMAFEWVADEKAFETLLDKSRPILRLTVPATGEREQIEITDASGRNPDLAFTPIKGTAYRYRVQRMHDRFQMPNGEVISLCLVEIDGPSGTFVRWVADDPRRTRDRPSTEDMSVGHADNLPLEKSFVMEYAPKHALVTIAAGPLPEQLRLIIATGIGAAVVRPLEIESPMRLGQGITLTAARYSSHTFEQSKPQIVPRASRNSNARARLSMVQIEVPTGEGDPEEHWLQFHDWPIRDTSESLGRVAYRPDEITLSDGRTIEVMFSRQRVALPTAVVLDDFQMETHVGGFTGQTNSILNWTSVIRFETEEGTSDAKSVSVNSPAEHDGFWYFQAQWDPPDERQGYRGLNFTVLGVGNRNGVVTMLLGCCVSVIGMIYAFYIKPVIKRRQRKRVFADVHANSPVADAEVEEPVELMAPMEDAR